MKLVLAASLSLLAMTACTKGNDPDIKVSTLTAKLDGSAMRAEETTWSLLNGQLYVQGKEGVRTITMKVPRYTGSGTYALSATGNEASCSVNNREYIQGNGTLIIFTDDTHYIKGRFSFTATQGNSSMKVEHGNFSFSK